MTLNSIFKTNERNLRNQLEGLYLPEDAKKIESTVSSFLTTLFESNGEFRQNLTQSEDYILQAALSLLHAQQEITENLANSFDKTQEFQPGTEIVKTRAINSEGSYSASQAVRMVKTTKVDPTGALIGSTGGALVGNILFGGWGAVFGALAGTAVSIYISSQKSEPVPTEKVKEVIIKEPQIRETKKIPLNVDKFIHIIEQICESVDNLIDTFRAQIKKVVNKYESQEKPSLDKNFPGLLESMQSLVGFARYHDSADEKYEKKIKSRIEEVLDQLDTQGIEVVDYTPEKAHLFEQIPSDKATEVKPVFPAFVKNGAAVVKGQVFVPNK